MANSAAVKVAILADNSDLNKSLADSQSKLASFGAAVGKIAIAAGVAAAAGLAVVGKASVDAASDAQQSIGATETVFGRFADNVVRSSNRAAEGLGLSANEYRNNANILGSLLGNQGVAQDKLAGKTKNLIGMGADLAATFGGTTTDAVNALASAYKGELDPLEQYGISIKQSQINTEAYAVAGVKSKAAFDELTATQQAAAKQQATSNLLTEQAAKSHGAFAKETDTLAHQQQVLGAQVENLKTRLGTALLPVVTDLFKVMNKNLIPTLSKLADQYLPSVRRALRDWVKEGGAEKLITNIGDAIQGVSWESISAKVSGFGDSLGEVDWETASSSFGELATTAKELGPALADISAESVNDSLSVFSELVGFAADHLDLLKKALPFIVTGFLALKAAQLLNNLAGRDSVIGLGLQWVATRRLIAANRELAATIREVNGVQATNLGQLGAVETAAGGATGKLSKLGPAASAAAGVAGLGLLAAGATTSNESLGRLETTAGAVVTGFAVGGVWGAALGGAISYLLDFKNTLDDVNEAIDVLEHSTDLPVLSQQIADSQKELDKARGHDDFSFVEDVLGIDPGWSQRQIAEVTGKTDELERSVKEGKRRLDGLRDGTLHLFNPVGDLAERIGGATQSFLDEADAAKDATDAMEAHRQEADKGLNAQLDYQQAILDANQSIEENGKTVDKTTEKGINNRRALYDLADAWNSQSNAAKNAKGSLKEAEDNFIATATAMGMPIEQAQTLADKLFEIPPKRKTKITLDGIDNAINKAEGLSAILDGLKDKRINVALNYQTIGNKPGAPLPGDPNSASDRSVPLRPRQTPVKVYVDGKEVASHVESHRRRQAVGAGRRVD